MKSEREYTNVLYEYFIGCFRFRRYRFGDSLPSIDSLCKKFAISDQTLKAALRCLHKDGYISIRKGKPAQVIFQLSEEQSNIYIRRFFSERWNALTDLIPTSELIFRPLAAEGFRRLDADCYAVLSILAEHAYPEDLIYFYFLLFRELRNPVITNLYWEFILFCGVPYICDRKITFYDANAVRKRLHTILTAGKKKDWELLNRELTVFWNEAADTALKSIEPYIVPVPAQKQLSFTWHIYRGRPQICYSLGSRIMHEIYMGCYRNQQFLPSYEKMAVDYGVSPNTIRRTIRLLTQLGVVRSINGKGTRIFSLGEHIDPPDYTIPAIRRNLVLFYQSFELLYYTCENMVHSALSARNEEKIAVLTEQLQEYIRVGCCEVTLWRLLISFSKLSPLQGLREIYSNVYLLFLWGYSLKASAAVSTEPEHMDSRFTRTIARHLKENDTEQCILVMKEYISLKFTATKNYLLRLGFRPEELLLSSSMQIPVRE